jgi:hypothetical protein
MMDAVADQLWMMFVGERKPRLAWEDGSLYVAGWAEQGGGEGGPGVNGPCTTKKLVEGDQSSASQAHTNQLFPFPATCPFPVPS